MDRCGVNGIPCCDPGSFYSLVFEHCVTCADQCPFQKRHTLECVKHCSRTTPGYFDIAHLEKTTPANAIESSSPTVYAFLIMLCVLSLAIVIACIVSLGFVLKGKKTSHHMKQSMKDIENGAEPLVVTANNHEMKVLLPNRETGYARETRNYANESPDTEYNSANSDENCDVGSEYLYQPVHTMTRGTDMSEDSLSDSNYRSNQTTNRVRHLSVSTQTSEDDILEPGNKCDSPIQDNNREGFRSTQSIQTGDLHTSDPAIVKNEKLNYEKWDGVYGTIGTQTRNWKSTDSSYYQVSDNCGTLAISDTQTASRNDVHHIDETLPHSTKPNMIRKHAMNHESPIEKVPVNYVNSAAEHIYSSIKDAPQREAYYENTQIETMRPPYCDYSNMFADVPNTLPQLQSETSDRAGQFQNSSILHRENEIPELLFKNGPYIDTTPKYPPDLQLKTNTSSSESHAEYRGDSDENLPGVIRAVIKTRKPESQEKIDKTNDDETTLKGRPSSSQTLNDAETNLKAHLPTQVENSYETLTKIKADVDTVPANAMTQHDLIATNNHISMNLPSPYRDEIKDPVIATCNALETENNTNLTNCTFGGNVLSQPSDDSDLAQRVNDDRSEYARAPAGCSKSPVERRLGNDTGGNILSQPSDDSGIALSNDGSRPDNIVSENRGTSRHISNQSDNRSEVTVREELELRHLMKELEEQPNYPIYEAIKELPFVNGFQSEGDSIEVFVDSKEIDKIQALAELVHISGADATKFQVTYL